MNYLKDKILEMLNIINIRKEGYTGKGIKIAIIDEGINSFKEKMEVSGGYNFIDNSDNYNDSSGHGTAIASIIKSKEFGIAANVEIYSLKIKISKE